MLMTIIIREKKSISMLLTANKMFVFKVLREVVRHTVVQRNPSVAFVALF